jgi:hypothetical protein
MDDLFGPTTDGRLMSPLVVTVVDAHVASDRENELLDGYRRMNLGEKPPGMLRSELLRGQDGAWRIQTTWRDMESLMALRKSGTPPAALELLEGLGAEHTHSWFTVEQTYDA